MKRKILMVARVVKITNPDGTIVLCLEIPHEEGSNRIKSLATSIGLEGIANEFFEAMKEYVPRNWSDL